MQEFRLNSNKARKEFWARLKDNVPDTTLHAALTNLHPVTAQVIKLHYIEGYSLPEIVLIHRRSISVIRNHRNRGIFKLYQAFITNVPGI